MSPFRTPLSSSIDSVSTLKIGIDDYGKIQLDPLGDYLNTCTTHSGAKKAHDWMVDQLADLFHTTHKVQTQ